MAMTPRERAAAALSLKIPDQVPHCELEYQLSEEMFGKDFLRQQDLEGKSQKEIDAAIYDNAVFMVHVYETLEYSIIPVHYLNEENQIKTAKAIHDIAGNRFMLTTHGDGTFSIPDGNHMLEFAYRMHDDPDDVLAQAQQMADEAIARNRRMAEGGFDSFIFCSDYCFNNGPFLSPAQFRKFVTPFLKQIVQATRAEGAFVIKHTDGDIMPILDQLVECEPHALHSLDPMAGVDIQKVKALVGNQVALIGNVHCAALQTGTDQDVIDSATYCMTHGKPGGGYIFSTSNVPFKGMDPARYQMILDVWKKLRAY